MQRRSFSNRAAIVLAAAVTSSLPLVAAAQTEFTISTSGATALGAFTRMNSNANSPTAATIVRGPLAVGLPTVSLGASNYNLQPGVSYLGIANLNGPVTGEPPLTNDRFVYWYRESGSVQGILDLCDSNGLLIASGNQPTRPGDPGSNLFLWVNGNRYTAPNSSGAFNSGRNIGQNYLPGGSPANPQTGQDFVRIAWSDVRFEQAFSQSGPANFNSTPVTPGYGLGRGNVGGTNFQALRNANAITGGVDPSTTRLRNESVAVIGFNLVSSPGTGLAAVTKEEAAWLQTTGRLPNGANFNSITREIGSGTRNQGALNLGVDPSWAAGERDRRSIAAGPINSVDVNGNPIVINPGDEMNPTLSLTGMNVQDPNENRTGPTVRFADKISGSSGVRATVVSSRMGLGILSAGDSRDNANGSALSIHTATSNPMRALAIDFGNGFGYRQATAENVTEGRYEMWSAAQAVTVAPYANPTLNDQQPGNEYRPINGDQNDQGANPTSNAQPGVHRKFLDNINKSVATYTGSGSAITPADFIVSASFIPPQIMGVTKVYDGGSLSTRTRNGDEQTLWNNNVANPSAPLASNNNWADPISFNGGLNINAVKYRIFASTNNALNATANRTIDVSSRTNLAGDMNNDGVRDLLDVTDLARAYANPDNYLATPQGAGVSATSTGTNAHPRDGLIVLTDFNANGNVTVDQNNASFATNAVERADVRYFLYGATVDTSGFNVPAAITINGTVRALSAVENRRLNGVRFGDLKKNQGIDTFNSTLDGFVGTLTNPTTGQPYTQAEVDALKFDKFDVNNDGARNRFDAIVVDRNVGRNFTSLVDVLSTDDDLVATELNDNKWITHVDPDGAGPLKSDMQLIIEALGSQVFGGDANLDGAVNGLDFNILATNFAQVVDRWSKADFNFDGLVNGIDFNILAANFGFSTPNDPPTPGDWDGLRAAIPEPGSLGLLMLAGAGLMARRRRTGVLENQ